MNCQEGYVYHINDHYFAKVQDEKLIMFPITEKYLDHIHTRNGNPVPVKHSISQQVRSNIQQIRRLVYKGKNIVFPDIIRLEKIMLEDLHSDRQQ